MGAEVTTLAQKLTEKRGNPLLLLVLETVLPMSVLEVERELKGRNFEVLDVVLHTPGGHIESAFNIVKLLRAHAKNVNVIVPASAKSAGTLITLAAEKILMTSIAELGPLDVQIKELEEGNGSTYKSALNGFKALQQIRQDALENLDIATKLILARTDGGMKLFDIIKLGIEFSGRTSGCLYNQLNPKYIGEYARALEVGEKYAVKILTRYRGWGEDKASEVANTLVYSYPSHGFIIDAQELRDLGFDAQEVVVDEREIVDDLKIFLMQAEEKGISFVKLFEKAEVEIEASSTGVSSSRI